MKTVKQERFDLVKEIIDERISTGKWIIDLKAGKIYNKKGKELGANIRNDGYKRIGTCFKGKSTSISVHLVISIVGGLDVVDLTINHIDGNKLNNSMNNLESVTQSENSQHGVDAGLIHTRKLPDGIVREIKIAMKKGVSKTELSKKYNITTRALRFMSNGVTYKGVTI
jgi:hypothetical protein